MKPNLPGTDPTSLGDHLADRLAANLAAEGRLPHQAFPSRREIGQRMKAPLARVNIAFDILHRRGLLYSIPRKGTFVAPVVRARQVLVVLAEGTEHRAIPGGGMDFLAGCLDAVRQGALPLGVVPLSFGELAPHLSDFPHAFPQASLVLFYRDPRWVEAWKKSRAFAAVPAGFYGSDTWLPKLGGFHHRLFQEESMIRQVVGHLVKAGHRRILFLGRTGDLMDRRRELFHRELKRQRVKPMPGDLRHDIPWSLEPEERLLAMGKLLQTAPKGFTALCCSEDQTAQLALHSLVRSGVPVPGQVAVTGIDDAPLSREAIVPITTVAVPIFDDARALLASMAGSMESPTPGTPLSKTVSQTRLLVRASTQNAKMKP